MTDAICREGMKRVARSLRWPIAMDRMLPHAEA